jgi:hypothetical protein
MSKATSSEKATHDSDRDKSVFSVDMQAMQSLQLIQKKPASELVQTNNTAVLAKFWDVCKRLNLDPLHAQALPCVVMLMSKNKHCVEMTHAYAELVQSADVLAAVDVQRETVVASCDLLLSSMADWLTLFSYLQLRAVPQQLLQQLESNAVLKVEGQPWVPVGSTVGPRFLAGIRGSPQEN